MAHPGFIVSQFCAVKIMAVTAVLSRSLQGVHQDLFEAIESMSFLQTKRANCHFSDVAGESDSWQNTDDDDAFTVASQLASTAGIQLLMPCLTGRQTSRNNMQASNPVDYYRQAVWYPYLDAIITLLTEKFSAHHMTIL